MEEELHGLASKFVKTKVRYEVRLTLRLCFFEHLNQGLDPKYTIITINIGHNW